MGFLYYGSYQILTKPIVGLKGEFQSQLQVLKNIGYITYISLLIYANLKKIHNYLFLSLNFKGSKEMVLKDLLLLMMLQYWRLLKLVS